MCVCARACVARTCTQATGPPTPCLTGCLAVACRHHHPPRSQATSLPPTTVVVSAPLGLHKPTPAPRRPTH